MNKVALITGGQRGIGLGIARALGKANYELVLTGSSKENAEAVHSALHELGPTARYYRHDIRDMEKIPSLLEKIETDLGPITSLVSNAGVAARIRGDLLNITPEDFDYVMDINLRGAFFLAQKIAQGMLESPSTHYRSIVFITSVSSCLVSINRAEYCISKAGASMMSKLFAARLAGENIGVFEIQPGIIETDMTSGIKDRYTTLIGSGLVPAKRWGSPGDIGSVVLSLVEGQMAFASGATIPVDGGLSIHRL